MIVKPLMQWIIIAFVFEVLLNTTVNALNIAIIGAGASGITSARRAMEQGHRVVVYEQMGTLGGVWYLTNRTGPDVHSPMYNNLRTNAPYQVMEFPGHQYPQGTPSYPTQDMVLQYLRSYAVKHGVKDRILVGHWVRSVKFLTNNKWRIITTNLYKQKNITAEFDAVMVCSGIFSFPRQPTLKFPGKWIHSHDYRSPEPYRGAKVLIIGNGGSGRDIVLQVSRVASHVFWSHRRNPRESDQMYKYRESLYGRNVTFIPADVEYFHQNAAVFNGGTIMYAITHVIYATGYLYKYPFLSESSGIQVTNNYVTPLYNQILNIKRTTMAFIGLTRPSNFFFYDIQARFAVPFITKIRHPPSSDVMYSDKEQYERKQEYQGRRMNKYHLIGRDYYPYLLNIIQIAGFTEYISPVYMNVLFDSIASMDLDPINFRSWRYVINDSYNFEKIQDRYNLGMHSRL